MALLFDQPASESDPRYDALRLALVSGVGPRIRQVLLERFGTPSAVFDAAPSELRDTPGVGPKLTRAIVTARAELDVNGLLQLCREHGIDALTESDSAYPRVLKEIPDPPGVLFVQGSILPQDGLSVAIVGSRHATHYGITMAERLAASVARSGLTIISGLARGVDAAAHRGALNAGGRTLAMLGSGLLNIYPPEHVELANAVAQQGALISESSPRSAPLKGTFPQRNRIISGMSLGVIVVEASVGSGALITARHAMEQNRDVFAVPGRVDSRMSHGCHRLIRDGAKLIESADDVLEELGPLVEATTSAAGQAIHHPAELLLNPQEQAVLGAIDTIPKSIDSVIVSSGLTTPQVLATLSVLEMRRLIKRISGNQVVRP